MKRIAGLDSIRAVLAAWVAMNHVVSFPLLAGLDRSTPLGLALNGAYGLLVNGQAAVIGFFVLSGFCVHYPYRRGLDSVPAFFVRRHVRVGLPLLATLGLKTWLTPEFRLLEDGVLWSVYAEIIYYTLYPLLLRLKFAVGWRRLLPASVLVYLAALYFDPTRHDANWGNYHSGGALVAAAMGLPCWLLGCLLADRVGVGKRAVGGGQVWSWRLAVWAASVGCYYLRFHTPIKHPYTLNLFAVLVYFWLQREIWHYETKAPPRLTEWAGGWSYSLYLMHFFGAAVFAWAALPNLGHFLNWAVKVAFVLGTAYAFYLAAERPSHQLARWLARRVRGPRPAPTAPKDPGPVPTGIVTAPKDPGPVPTGIVAETTS
jgi:peptidoglycan/LPS O-acetylase OafA/YrhL